MTVTNTRTNMNDMQLTALQYMERGWKIHPVIYKEKRPGYDNVLLHKWGTYEFNVSHFDGLVNIGVAMGKPSNWLVDIDLDCPEAVTLASRFLPNTNAQFGRFTCGQRNNIRGHWLYYAEGAEIAALPDQAKQMIIELRSTGGQTVFPPSTHESGDNIKWTREGEPAKVDVKVLAAAVGKVAAAVIVLRHYMGSRHIQIGPLTGFLRKGGMSADDTMAFLMAIVEESGDRERSDRERFIKETNRKFDNGDDVSGHDALVENGYDDVALRLISKYLGLVKKRASVEEAVRCTDSGNANYLIERFGDQMKYCSEMAMWFGWNGRNWEADKLDRFLIIAEKVVREMIDECNQQRAPRQLMDWCIKSLNLPKLRAMDQIARAGLAVSANDFDSNPWLLNVGNGTINLKTGELHPHNRDDMNSRMCRANYDADATCPRFMKFLSEIMCDNEDLINFLQRAFGYSLTGSVSEQCLFILHGQGSNGKGVLIGILKELLEGYFHQSAFNTFLQRNAVSDAPRSDIASLIGKRLVSASEANESVRLDEALIKQLTGGDVISARFLFKDEMTFDPTFKIWLSTNYKPEIRGHDDAIWDRVKLIPFEARFPRGTSKCDPHLGEKLRDELPGILAWAVRGCLEHQRCGLNTPTEVQTATSKYRDESNLLNDFLATNVTHSGEVTAADLYLAYQGWCKTHGRKPITVTTFGKQLGFHMKRYNEMHGEDSISKKSTSRNGVEALYYFGLSLTESGKRMRHLWTPDEVPF